MSGSGWGRGVADAVSNEDMPGTDAQCNSW